jgi:hypothetical protein
MNLVAQVMGSWGHGKQCGGYFEVKPWGQGQATTLQLQLICNHFQKKRVKECHVYLANLVSPFH